MTEPKERNVTSKINEQIYCKDCGWPIITNCCNGMMLSFQNANMYDWWTYCSNKACKNHNGEGDEIFHDPSWSKSKDSEVLEGQVAAKPSVTSAAISDRYYCTGCGWPVIEGCCNDGVDDYLESIGDDGGDWIIYCTNKGCSNHKGTGICPSDDKPSWVGELP